MNFNPNQPHNLEMLPPKAEIETTSILKALSSASRILGELKGYCLSVPNPEVLMSITMTQESVESSKIEGINTTVEGFLENQAIPESKQKGPNKEALRYKQAVNWGMGNISNYSLSTKLILEIHRKLLETSFGYRKQQNAIKDTIENKIIYTPPIASKIDALMQNWENFVNLDNKKFDPIIRCIIAHYQFEAIHPFIDGNGRTGRILLALQMVNEDLLDFPVLYISNYLNENRNLYYQALNLVTGKGDWNNYILFMLKGFQMQALKTQKSLFEMMTLNKKLIKEIRSNHTKINAIETVNHIFSYAYTTPTLFAKSLNIHYQTALRHLKELKAANILDDSRFGKYHLYYNKALLDMMKS